MIDPMADIGAATPTPGAGGDAMNVSKEVFDPIALQRNVQIIDKIRSVMGIASGCVAGTIGLTSLEGLVGFIILHTFVALVLYALKMNFNLKSYLNFSWYTYLTFNIQQHALSFTLFWTLFYGLVYLY